MRLYGADITGSLQTTGSISLSGSFKDQENSPGTAGQVLSSTVSGSQWVDVGGSGIGDVTKTGTIVANQIAIWNNTTNQLRSDPTFVIDSNYKITLYQPNSSNNDRSSYNIGGGNIDNVTGQFNTGFGKNNLTSIVAGSQNIAIGANALSTNTDGDFNIAVGYNSLLSLTTGYSNTAYGNQTLQANTYASQNSAFGANALILNVSGASNTALGYLSLGANTSGPNNVAVGALALRNSTGTTNTAIGHSAGSAITTGDKNVIIGTNTGSTIATSDNNIIISDGSGNNRIQVDSGGNVGIGTTSPSSKLTVVGGTSTFVYDNSPQGTASSVYRDAVFGSTQTVNTGITIFGTGQTGIAFGDAASHIRGQVRYQHSSDTLELGAAGNINLSISSTGAATFSNYIDTPEVRQGGEFMIGRSSNVIRMGSGDSSDSLAFYAGASQRLSITSGGDLGTRGYTASGSVSGTTYSTLNTEIIHSNGSGMKYLGKLIIRDGSRYLDIAINTTSNNIMYYFMVKGYLYNRGMYVGITSGYTYSGTIININNGTILQVGGATKSIISYRGTNSTAGNYTGHLCLRFDSGANGYSEGVLELYVGTHSSTYQNAFQIHRYAQNNTSNPWFAQ